jgi:biopolymer transport protein ExbB
MKLVEWVYRVLISTGSGWVMWALILLSVLSVAIILERAWFFLSLRDDIGQLARDLQRSLETGIEAAKKRMSASPSAEAAVVVAGLEMAERGPEAAEEAMNGAAAIQRIKLEKRLAFLGTLGNNAPVIGLFGTVIGVMIAFGKLSPDQTTGQTAGVSKDVMTGISEALVATAVGIFVAIPAVAFNNLFQRMTKATLANTDALSKTLLAFLKTNTSYRLPDLRDGYRKAPEKSFAEKDGDDEDERPAPKKEKVKESPKKKPPVQESASEEDA